MSAKPSKRHWPLSIAIAAGAILSVGGLGVFLYLVEEGGNMPMIKPSKLSLCTSIEMA